MLESNAALQREALATLAQARLATGSAQQALRFAERAVADLGPSDEAHIGESLVRLSYALALDAVGRGALARIAVQHATRRLFERAEKMAEPAQRVSFLAGVPESAQLIELARQWQLAPVRETPSAEPVS